MNKSYKLSRKHGYKFSKCDFQSGRDLEIVNKNFVSFASNKSQAPKAPKANIKAEWPKNSTGDSMLSNVNEKLMSCRSNIKMRGFGEVSVDECKIMPKSGTSDLIQKSANAILVCILKFLLDLIPKSLPDFHIVASEIIKYRSEILKWKDKCFGGT